MKKYVIGFGVFIIILVITLIVLSIPNVTIYNDQQVKIIIDGKYIGNSKKILTRLDRGNHIIEAGDRPKSITHTRLGGFWHKVRIGVDAYKKAKTVSAASLTPTVKYAETKENILYYLGGRQSNYLLSYNLLNNKLNNFLENPYAGINRVIWSPDKKFVIIFVEQYHLINERTSDALILIEKNTGKETSLNFTDAIFQDDQNIIGLKNGRLIKYNNDKYTELNVNIPTHNILFGNQGHIAGFGQNKIIYLEKADLNPVEYIFNGKIDNPHLSGDGSEALFTLKDGANEKLTTLNLKTGEQLTWPVKTGQLSLAYSESNIFYATDNDNQIWEINPQNRFAKTIFQLPMRCSSLFSDQEKIYAISKGEVFIIER